MTNTYKLKGRITEKGYSLKSFAEALHMSRPCLRSRLNGTTDFRVSEIERICDILGIANGDIGIYFFCTSVPNLAT